MSVFRFGRRARLRQQVKTMAKSARTYIAVVDGAHRRLFLKAGDDKPLALISERKIYLDKELPRGTKDTRGRTFDSSGQGGRHRMEGADPRQEAEDRFLKDTAHLLSSAIERKEADQVVIIAPPKALGTLRQSYSKSLKHKIASEIRADLTNAPDREIAARVADIQ